MAAARGRGGAALVALGVLLLCVLLPATGAAAKTYMVGDAAGWTKNLEATWLAGKTFYAGDVLGKLPRCPSSMSSLAS